MQSEQEELRVGAGRVLGVDWARWGSSSCRVDVAKMRSGEESLSRRAVAGLRVMVQPVGNAMGFIQVVGYRCLSGGIVPSIMRNLPKTRGSMLDPSRGVVGTWLRSRGALGPRDRGTMCLNTGDQVGDAHRFAIL